MNKDFKILSDWLQDTNFVFNASLPSYNPMEWFAKHVEKKELVHSEIIADLLNPSGQHGLGRSFLDFFLSKCDVSPSLFPSPKIFKEYTLHGDRWGGRRIDILIVDDSIDCINAVIVENKLNEATYQPNQLEDYQEAIEKDFEPQNLKTICLHRNYVSEKGLADRILYPKDLAVMIEIAIEQSSHADFIPLKTYTRYLHNLNISNIDMDNAKVLYNRIKEAPEELNALRLLMSAYNNLPLIYAEEYHQTHSSEARRSKNYGRYIEVKVAPSLYVGVGFFEKEINFYLICEDSKYTPSETFGLEFDSSAYGQNWYKVGNIVENYTFSSIPDFKEIDNRVTSIRNHCQKKLLS